MAERRRVRFLIFTDGNSTIDVDPEPVIRWLRWLEDLWAAELQVGDVGEP